MPAMSPCVSVMKVRMPAGFAANLFAHGIHGGVERAQRQLRCGRPTSGGPAGSCRAARRRRRRRGRSRQPDRSHAWCGAASTVAPYLAAKLDRICSSVAPEAMAALSSSRIWPDEGQPTWLHSPRSCAQLQVHMRRWLRLLKRGAGVGRAGGEADGDGQEQGLGRFDARESEPVASFPFAKTRDGWGTRFGHFGSANCRSFALFASRTFAQDDRLLRGCHQSPPFSAGPGRGGAPGTRRDAVAGRGWARAR